MNPFVFLIRRIVLGHKASSELYIQYLRNKGARIGKGVKVFSPNQTYIDEQFPFMISIGNNVNITLGVHILTHDYSWSVIKNIKGECLGGVGKVEIGNNVFIGVGSIILMNTHIGNNVIIGAGSIVSGIIPDNSVVAGSPARVICGLSDYIVKRESRQYQEAKEIVLEYRKSFGCNPPKEKLPAYFFLFEPREEMNNEVFLSRLRLTGNYDESLAFFKSTEPMFNGYDEFLNSI